MKSRPIIRMALLALSSLLWGAGVQGQNPANPQREAGARAVVPKGPIKSPSGASFSIAPAAEMPGEFDIIVSDGEESVVSGSFNVFQLEVLKEIMNEARKFAISEEGVDKDQPTTSRFSTKQERSFIIDVTKSANQSQFFFTLKTQVGHITLDAGSIKRADRREEGFFYEILARIKAEIASLPAQPSR